MNPIRIEISPGELIDRITILQLKVQHMQGPRQARVREELEALLAAKAQLLPASAALANLSEELLAVNRQLWDVENQLRLLEQQQDFGPRFIALARSVYQRNDCRCALKQQINQLLGATLLEEKIYAASTPAHSSHA